MDIHKCGARYFNTPYLHTFADSYFRLHLPEVDDTLVKDKALKNQLIQGAAKNHNIYRGWVGALCKLLKREENYYG
ncbi:MAG: hypothetical protein AYK19_05755 [Theionarchaea archaeon DG-70-1]|nr:MAG: hypothetical protein AYK19_05755 [Theionarchaea archaeon DG-70-1]